MSSPAHKIRISNLTAVIWRNFSEKGAWYSVQLKRSYRTDDDLWRETEALGFDDLLSAAKLLDLAHNWIMHQRLAAAKARKQSKQAS